jgi:hypothetical protein
MQASDVLIWTFFVLVVGVVAAPMAYLLFIREAQWDTCRTISRPCRP